MWVLLLIFWKKYVFLTYIYIFCRFPLRVLPPGFVEEGMSDMQLDKLSLYQSSRCGVSLFLPDVKSHPGHSPAFSAKVPTWTALSPLRVNASATHCIHKWEEGWKADLPNSSYSGNSTLISSGIIYYWFTIDNCSVNSKLWNLK